MATVVREVNSFGLWDGPALKYTPIKLGKDETEENSEDPMGSALRKIIGHAKRGLICKVHLRCGTTCNCQ